jgi:hypothetical protein
MSTCISEPISWLRLEQHALAMTAADERAAIETHLAACDACRSALQALQNDALVMPALPALERTFGIPRNGGQVISLDAARQKARTRRWLVPTTISTVIAAAAAVMLWVRSNHTGPHGETSQPTRALHATSNVKGAGELALQVARDRNGNVQTNVATFRVGDRWKTLLTCAPSTSTTLWADVVVFEVAQGGGPDLVPAFPLAPSQLECGNAVALPGAFEITGTHENIVCVVITTDAPLNRTAVGPALLTSPDAVCTSVKPE